MPLGPVAEFILQPIAEVVLHILGYMTARVAVPVVTLGRVRVAHWNSRPRRTRAGRSPRVRIQVPAAPGGVRTMDAELAAFLGLMFWLAAAIAGVIVWHRLRS